MARNDPHTVDSMKAKHAEERKDVPGKVGSDPQAAEHFAGEHDFGDDNSQPNAERQRDANRIHNRESQAKPRYPGDVASPRADDTNFVAPGARPTQRENTASTQAGQDLGGKTIGQDENEGIDQNKANRSIGRTTNVNNPARDDDAFAGDVSMDEASGDSSKDA